MLLNVHVFDVGKAEHESGWCSNTISALTNSRPLAGFTVVTLKPVCWQDIVMAYVSVDSWYTIEPKTVSPGCTTPDLLCVNTPFDQVYSPLKIVYSGAPSAQARMGWSSV